MSSRSTGAGRRHALLHIETLEPRLLLSADLLPGVDPAALGNTVPPDDPSSTVTFAAAGDATGPAIVRSVDEVLNPGQTAAVTTPFIAPSNAGGSTADTSPADILASSAALASLVFGPAASAHDILDGDPEPTDIAVLKAGVDAILDALVTTLQTGTVIGEDLPLIGDGLKASTDFVGAIKTAFDGAFGGVAGTQAALSEIRHAVATGFGLADSDVSLYLDGTDASRGTLWNGTDLTPAQIAALNDLEFQFTKTKHVDLGAINLDVGDGLPGFGLNVTTAGTIEADLDYSIVFDFGINRVNNFYMRSTTATDVHVGVDVSAADDAHLLAQLGLLQLGFLQDTTAGSTGITGQINLDIADGHRTVNSAGIASLIAGSAVSVDLEAQAHMKTVLGFDLGFDNGAYGDISGKLPHLTSDFVLDWHITSNDLSAGTAPTVELDDIKLNIGSFITDFLKPITEPINEILNPIAPVLDFLTSPMPVIKDIGPLDDLIKSATKDATHPNGDDTPLGMAKILTSGPFQAVAAALGITLPSQADIIAAEKFVETLQFIRQVAQLAGTGDILLGDFKFYGKDLREARGASANAMPTSFDANTGLLADVSHDPQIPAALANGMASGLSLPLLSNPSSIIKLMFGEQIDLLKLALPDFDFKFEFHIPPVVLLWPVPPVFLDLGGIFEVKTHLVLGYDTRGISQFVTSHSEADLINGLYVERNADQPLIEVISTLLAGGTAGIPGVVTVSIDGGLGADLKFNLGGTIIDNKLYVDQIGHGAGDLGCLFEMSGEATFGIYARIDTPAKGFFDSIWDAATSVVDAFGDLLNTVTLGASGEVLGALEDFLTSVADNVTDAVNTLVSTLNDAVPGLGSLLKEGIMNFWFGPFAHLGDLKELLSEDGSVVLAGPYKLFGFTAGDCLSDNPLPPALAELLPDGTLELNVGGRRDQRHIADDEINENYTVTAVSPGIVDVSAFGITQRYGDAAHPVLQVHGLFDDGDDGLKVIGRPTRADNTAIIFDLDGGIGNDHLEGGWGDDTIRGGEGADEIIGGEGNDRLFANSSTSQGARLDGAGNVISDHISGGRGDDLIFGGAGDDALHGNDGADTVYGGDGTDVITGDAGADILYGLLGDDAINGGDDHDLVFGGADRDMLFGGGGDDEIHGDLDTRAITDATALALYGGAGNTTENAAWGDYIFGGSPEDVKADIDANAYAPAGSDLRNRLDAFAFLLHGGNQADGNDTIDGNAGDDLIFGNGGNDTLAGNDGNDTILGNAGDDTITGNLGNDTAFGGTGADLMFGNAGDDKLDGGADRDIIFGDTGGIARSGGNITVIASLVSLGDGNDSISGGDGGDYLIGGSGGDTINGDDPLAGGSAASPGNDVVIGDQGLIQFQDFNAGKISVIATTDAAGTGGIDTIRGNGGDDVVFGGVAADDIAGGNGRDILFGDQGVLIYQNGSPQIAYSTDSDPALGGPDTIKGEAGDDVVIGGIGGDQIDTGGNGADLGNDVLLGDQGVVVLATGQGFATYIATIDTSTGQGGADTIVGGDGNDVALGGIGADTMTGGVGIDILIGDQGQVGYAADGSLHYAVTADTAATVSLGGVDTITGDGGDDIVMGGVAGDHLSGGADDDIIVGDQGAAIFSAGVRSAVYSTETSAVLGGADDIKGDDGNDVIIGGIGGDGISGGAGKDTIVGDQGVMAYSAGAPYLVQSTDTGTTLGGVDIIAGDAGDDIVIGGTAGDQIDTGGNGADLGNDILLGDQGVVVFTAGPAGFPYFITTTDTAGPQGGSDTIFGGDGNDVAMGGIGADTITGGVGRDILIGDEGQAAYGTGDGLPAYVVTTDTPANAALGGIDTIAGDGGDDIVMGGVAGDLLAGGTENDIVIGDQGVVLFSAGLRSIVYTNDSSAALGGVDQIRGDAGDDIVMGGAAGDQIDTAGAGADLGNDILLGDQGVVVFTAGPAGFPYYISTTDTTGPQGGADTILGGDGNDIAMGGIGADSITGGVGRDILIGDEGQIGYATTTGLLSYIVSTDTVATAPLGGIDTITGDGGDDVILGGVAGDLLFGGADDDVIIGDQGALYYAAGVITTIATTDSAVVQGGNDQIEGNDGDDTALGGIGADRINGDDPLAGGVAADPGDDILIGDQGLIQFQNGIRFRIVTTDTGDLLGGNDTIKGNARNDIILGGVGSDDLSGGTGRDFILGDEGELLWSLASDSVTGRSDVSTIVLDGDLATLDRVTTILPLLGAGDVIRGDEDNDIVFGGAGSDLVNGDRQDLDQPAQGAGDDIIFGDFGKLYPTLGANAAPGSLFFNNFFFSIDTNATAKGAADIVFGNGGGDILIGGQGDDLLSGGEGDDDLIGGHNISGSLGTPFGETGVDELDPLDAAGLEALKAEISLVAGNVTDTTVSLADLDPTAIHPFNDTLLGGEGDDVIVGDNGIVVRKGPNMLTGAFNPDFTDPRFRLAAPGGIETAVTTDIGGLLAAAGAPLITTGFAAGVDNAAQPNPYGTLVRTVTVLDQSIDVLKAAIANPSAPRAFGNEFIAGGGGRDLIFGGAGDDTIQGDGDIPLLNGNLGATPAGTLIKPTDDQSFNARVIDLAADFQIPPAIPLAGNLPAGLSSLFTIRFVVADKATDADDYIEGGAGNDRLYGNGGSDDIIGGSAIGYANQGPAIRTDGADLIYGDDDNRALLARNFEDPNALHATDADVIIGDNGAIFRIVAPGGDGITLARFNYDDPAVQGYSAASPIAVRATELHNYGYAYTGPATAAKLTFAGIGAGDLIFGEAGDDVVYGATGNDVIYGSSGDDDLIGGHGADVLLGGTGVDGLIGDDGIVGTARVPTAAAPIGEPLHGITFDAADIGKLITSLDPVTGLSFQQDVINIPGTLVKYVSLASYHADDLIAAGMSFDDIIYGGLGTDYIHSGAGDDAVSGAEALPFYYDATGAAGGFTEVNHVLDLQQQHGTVLHPALAAQPFWYSYAIYNPGHVLNFNGNWDPATGIFYPLGSKVDEFAYYDELDPRRKIMLDAAGNAVKTSGEAKYDFLLNFNETEGPGDTRWTDPAADPGTKPTDGDDRIFGNDGNDWLVGATGRDHTYGGRGYDLINMDDNLNSPVDFTLPVPGLNFAPWTGDLENNTIDPFQAYADVAFGGSGSDIYIINTGADRAIDAFGSFDAYWTVFTPFGAPTIDRNSGDGVTHFLEALSKADGADQRMPDGQQYVLDKLAAPATPNPLLLRHYEPYGELGRIIAGDAFDSKEHFNPTDPQPGYISTPSDSSIRLVDKLLVTSQPPTSAEARSSFALLARSSSNEAPSGGRTTAATTQGIVAIVRPQLHVSTASIVSTATIEGAQADASSIETATLQADAGPDASDDLAANTVTLAANEPLPPAVDDGNATTLPGQSMDALRQSITDNAEEDAESEGSVWTPGLDLVLPAAKLAADGATVFGSLAAPMIDANEIVKALLLAGLPVVPALALRKGAAEATRRWNPKGPDGSGRDGMLQFDPISGSFLWHGNCADGETGLLQPCAAGSDPFDDGDDAWLVGSPVGACHAQRIV